MQMKRYLGMLHAELEEPFWMILHTSNTSSII